MAGMLRVPRSRGALSGVFLVLLGAWGALIPFIGPYFHYAYTPDSAWTYNTGRLWLEVLPGAATWLAGLIVLTAVTRPVAIFGAWLGAMSGAWFVVGVPLSALWTTGGVPAAGSPVGSTTLTRAVEQIGFFGGLGAAIIFFAALALGRFTVLGHREVMLAEEYAAEEARAQRAAAGQDATRGTEAQSPTERFSLRGPSADPDATTESPSAFSPGPDYPARRGG